LTFAYGIKPNNSRLTDDDNMITEVDIVIKCLEHFLAVAYLREGGGQIPPDPILNTIQHVYV